MTTSANDGDIVIPRKKNVEKFSPNTYRVISMEAEGFTEAIPVPRQRVSSEQYYSRPLNYRQNRPNTTNVGFLTQNCHLLHAPICNVRTNETNREQDRWKAHKSANTKITIPVHTNDTISRQDYQFRGQNKCHNTRHSSNPHQSPTRGAVPVNYLRDPTGKQRIWKEGISYEHHYNCREDPNYTLRGKRQGGFVWDRFSDKAVDKMLHHYGIVADKCQQTSASADAGSGMYSPMEECSPKKECSPRDQCLPKDKCSLKKECLPNEGCSTRKDCVKAPALCNQNACCVTLPPIIC